MQDTPVITVMFQGIHDPIDFLVSQPLGLSNFIKSNFSEVVKLLVAVFSKLKVLFNLLVASEKTFLQLLLPLLYYSYSILNGPRCLLLGCNARPDFRAP